jgi:hypothetical protein
VKSEFQFITPTQSIKIIKGEEKKLEPVSADIREIRIMHGA